MIFYKQSELCKLAYKYGSDKCPKLKHTYTPYYHEVFKSKKTSVKKVLEIGIGNKKLMGHVVKLKGSYQPGASLLMWRDYFPNAKIYGADILSQSMIKSDRVSTFVTDQRSRNDLKKLVQITGNDLDIVIDDGSNSWRDKVSTCLSLMPMLKKDVFYIIEDVKYPGTIVKALSKYDCTIPNIAYQHGDNRLVVVRNKQHGIG